MRLYRWFLIFFSAFSLFAANRDVQYIEGDVLVKFISPEIKPETNPKVRSLNLIPAKRFRSFPSLHYFKIPSGLDTKKVVEELSSDPDILYAEPNYIYKALIEPDDTYYGNQWGLTKISAPSGWDKTAGSSEVIIAVIDSGIDYNHPDLSDNVWTDSENNPGYNAIKNNSNPMDDNSHGTHCSGIIGAIGNNGIGVCGVNWTIKIMALKFLDATGNGTLADAIECIDYVIRRKDEGEKIVATSNSWGGYVYSSSLYDAIARLAEKGILFVAAAGNSSRNNDVTPLYPASYNLHNIISVAGSDQNDNRSYFSNYGRTTVHIAAPGSSIYSTILSEGYGYKSGTSMATPFVAGVAGLLTSLTDETNAETLKYWILSGITRLPQWTNLSITGGRLNVYESLRVASLPDYIMPARNFKVEKAPGGIQLTWDIPEGANYVIIRRAEETFPSHWEEGVLVYTGGDTSYIDEDIEEGKPYYYTIWAYYGMDQQIEEDRISSACYAYTNSPPMRPECISPADESEGVSLTPLLKATGFVDPDNDYHIASHWQIASDGNFSNIVWNSITSATTEITVPSGVLSYSTKYYWRVRYQDENDEWSDWSIAWSFTTKGSSSGGGGGGGCFIATAAFGTPIAEEVIKLKDFRDKYLMKSRAGRTFVRWYYRHSPKIAEYIRQRKWAKILVRASLRPILWIVSKID
ncbi:MAG: S8 family serine peptidase [Candidatus Omnitrophica bacterium]|nr:S8 family serine peptidase [Candidatus Omnitrophota bacterium]